VVLALVGLRFWTVDLTLDRLRFWLRSTCIFLLRLSCGFDFGYNEVLSSVGLRFWLRLGYGLTSAELRFGFGWAVVLASVGLQIWLRLSCGFGFDWDAVMASVEL